MPKDKTQLSRLIFIDKKIREGMKSGRYANCSNMAREYEVSSKSIQRDIDYLKNQRNAPILYDQKKRGYYYTEDTYTLPALDISAGDLFAICIAQEVFKQHENTPIYKKLTSVFNKIEESLPEKVSVLPSWLGTRVSIVGDYKTFINPDIWESIAHSLQQKKVLQVNYKKPHTQHAKDRFIAPYHIVSFQGEWYVIAFCNKRQKVLTFAISRIVKAHITKEAFSIPEDFNYKKSCMNRFGIFHGKNTFTVKILFDKHHAAYIEEREWHPSQKLHKQKDGSVILSLSASHYQEIKRWVYSWGNGAQVLEPKELRAEIKSELDKMVSQYT